MQVNLSDSEINAIDKEVEKIYKSEIREDDYIGTSMQLFYKDMSKYGLLSREEEQDLANRYNSGDKRAGELLTIHNLRLVVSIAKSFIWSEIPLEDLVMEGVLGLMRAIETFEPERNLKLSTYSTWWIRQYISRYVDDNQDMIRLPVHLKEGLRKLNKWISSYVSENHKQPSEKEIICKAEEIGISEDTYRCYISTNKCVSLNMPIMLDGDSKDELGNLLPDKKPSVENLGIGDSLKETIDSQLSQVLTDTELKVLYMRYYDEMTLEACGKIMGITRERVRQIEAKAIRKSRFSWRCRHLREIIKQG